MKDISITTDTKKPLVFVCTRFAPCERHPAPLFVGPVAGKILLDWTHPHVTRTQEIVTALSHEGYAPYAPHLYLPAAYSSDDGDVRAMGMTVGASFLRRCRFLFVDKSDGISTGMGKEILFAMKLKKEIRECYWPYEVESLKCATTRSFMGSRWPRALREETIPHQGDCGGRLRVWDRNGLSPTHVRGESIRPGAGFARLFARSR